jgi:hypothetical protein
MSEVDQYTNLLYALAGTGVAGFVAYVISQLSKLKDRLHQIEIDMRDKFATNDQIEEVRAKVDRALEILLELCGKLGVPVRRD